MQLGYANKATCQIVGINLRTGRKWRNGRTGENRTVAPAFGQQAPRSTFTRYLRIEERIHIADRLCEKVAIREIAWELGRNPGGSRRRSAKPAELNARPRKTFDWETPAERLAKLLMA